MRQEDQKNVMWAPVEMRVLVRRGWSMLSNSAEDRI